MQIFMNTQWCLQCFRHVGEVMKRACYLLPLILAHTHNNSEDVEDQHHCTCAVENRCSWTAAAWKTEWKLDKAGSESASRGEKNKSQPVAAICCVFPLSEVTYLPTSYFAIKYFYWCIHSPSACTVYYSQPFPRIPFFFQRQWILVHINQLAVLLLYLNTQ